MLKMKKEDVLRKYLGEERLRELNNLYVTIEKSDIEIDDKAYNDMINLLIKYCTLEPERFYIYFIFRDILKKYYDLSCKLISKITNYESKEVYDIYKFINIYTENNLNYKLSIINEFMHFGIIEERASFDFNSYDFYKKLLQILSIKYKKGYDKDSVELYKQSKLSIIQGKAKDITQKVIKYNKDSYLINQEYFVKPTNSVMEIMCSLPDIIVDNEEDFKELIDYLYKLLWESKARGYAKNNELDFINNIRRYYYHDLEHGKDSEVKKKFMLVRNFYKESTGKNIPLTAKDWQNAQEHIYDLIIDFLENVRINELIVI